MSRNRALGIVLAVVWFGSIIVARGFEHPLVGGFQRFMPSSVNEPGDSAEQPLQEFLAAVDATVEPGTEIAYWWPGFRELGYPALGLSFVTARYRLQPRTIYPLLSSADLDELHAAIDVDPRFFGFLRERSDLLENGKTDVKIVVASCCGPESCQADEWPNLIPVQRIGQGCLLGLSTRSGAN